MRSLQSRLFEHETALGVPVPGTHSSSALQSCPPAHGQVEPQPSDPQYLKLSQTG